MKLGLVLILLVGFNHSFAQTIDFTISLLIRFSINENLCCDLSNSHKLIILPKGEDYCVFRCDLNSICVKADSNILTVGLKPFNFYDSKTTIEFRQYYSRLDSAIKEFKAYRDCIIKEAKSDIIFYRCNVKTIKNWDFIDPGTKKLKYIYTTDLILFRSLYIWSNLYLSLEKDQDKFIILMHLN